MNSDRIMNGDTVLVRGKELVVEIVGHQGAYRIIDGQYVNCAIGNAGFLFDPKSGHQYRAKWEKLTVVKRAFPQLFNKEN